MNIKIYKLFLQSLILKRKMKMTNPINLITSDDKLVERLRVPSQWCCIFRHESVTRHGTSKAPFEAADRIASLEVEVARRGQLVRDAADELETAGQPIRAHGLRVALDGGFNA
jgi:hypothetical protein